MQKAAIVILNYNGRKVLEEFLPSVVSHSFFPIIVVDNYSTDNSIDLLNTHFPNIEQVNLPENFGYSGGYNQGLNNIKGRFENFILLNSDVEVTPNWDVELIQQLESHKSFVAIQPKILSYHQPAFFEYAGAGGGFIDRFGYPYCRGRIFDTVEKDQGQYDDFIEVDWASGACMVIRSEAFYKEGGFDESFFAHMEEIDLCWRLRRKGHHIGYYGGVAVKHLGGGTLHKTNAYKTFLNFRNSLRMLRKNIPTDSFSKIYFWRFVLDLLAGLKFLAEGRFQHAKAIYHAHQDWKNYEPIRMDEGKSVDFKEVHPIRSIAWTYFVLGKKRFSEF
jgi:GT2 family glycosyltransferase